MRTMYVGTIRHRRFAVRDHAFKYRLALAYRQVERAPVPCDEVWLLSTVRGFNPVSFYYCYTGGELTAIVAEVTNTPWGETHSYLLGRAGSEHVIRGEIDKAFHVSPLMDMDHTYDWRSTEPGKRVQVHIDSRSAGDGGSDFDATLSLERVELSRASTRRVLTRYPAMTMQVMAKIYWQSLRLWLKGAPYFPHPERG